MSVIKKFGIDFHSEGGALTLSNSQVSDSGALCGFHTKTHPSGWTITAEVHEDYYAWVNYFVAIHSELGFVRGDFEGEVEAFSEDAFVHFYKHHTPEAWDYQDI